MKILVKIRRFAELRRLRAATRSKASPSTLGALAERYISLGRIDDANRTATLGLSMFPTSQRLAKILSFAKKHRLQDDIRRLRKELAARPAPIVYMQLAKIYKELGKYEQTLAISQECIERFPLNENPYLIIGEIRLGRFISDLIAHDGLEAGKQLRRVVKLNQQNVKAHMLLAQLAYVAGDVNMTAEHLDAVLASAPGNSDLRSFITELRARDPDDDDLTVSDRIREVELVGALVNSPEDIPGGGRLPGQSRSQATELNEKTLKRGLKEIGRTPGVTNATVVDREGQSLADYADAEAIPEADFADLVKEIVATSVDAARRMDVGGFQWCSVEGEFGGVAVTRAKNLSVAMMFGTKLRADRATFLLDEFTSRSLTAPGEVANA